MVSLLVVFASSLVFAQDGESGGVAGLVKDPSGAVVSGASVDVYNEQTKELERHTVTSLAGEYSVGSLRPGSYRVEIKAKGFRTYISKFQAWLNEVERHDVALDVGASSETVEVNAAGTLVNTESPTTGQPIDNQTLTTLPLAEPNYLFLLALSPGTGTEPTDVRKAGRSNVDISVNGQRTTNNSVTMEGINIDDFNLAHFDYLPIPNPEAIQEFKVATSLYDASLGSKGGGALALVLKSGTKNLHFGGWWNARNDFFNANEWFRDHSTPRPLPTGKLTQNVVGVQASGRFPWLKGFWYVNVQGVRGRNGIDPSGSAINPTLPAFPTNPNGTTSAALLAAAYGVPASSIDPVALNILNFKSNFYGGTYLIPRPGQPQCSSTVAPASGSGQPGTFSCAFSGISKPKDTQFTIRYDRAWRHDKDKLQIGLFWDNGDTFKPFGTATDLAFPQDSIIQNRFGNVSYITQISNRQLNELKFGVSRFVFSNTPTAEITLSDVGSTRPDQSTFPGLWEFSTGINSVGIGVNDFRGTAQNSYQWGDNWSMVVGKHTLRAGGDIYRYQLNRFNNFGVFGNLGFSPDANSQATGWLDFITGTVTSTQAGAGNPERYFRAWAGDMYLQDDYRWSSRLTINVGLRWEPMEFAHDRYFRNSNYSFPLAQAGQDPFLFPASLNQNGVKGTPGVSDCALQHCWDLKNFAPRVGLAWDVSGNRKTVLRGGYGIYWQQISNQAELSGSLGAPFFVSQITIIGMPPSGVLANPVPHQVSGGGRVLPQHVPQKSIFTGLSNGLGSVNDPTTNVLWTDPAGTLCGISGGPALDCSIDLDSFSSADPNLHSPYTQQWNLTLQRKLGHNWAMEIGYVGSHNVGGIAIWVPYQARLASPTNPITVKDSSGNPYTITTNNYANETLREQALGLSFLTGSSYTSNVGNQIYHSGQLTLSHRFQGGLFFQAGYTFARNIDNVSGSVNTDELNATASGSQGGASIYNEQNNLSQNRALSDLDRPHRLSISYGYEIPVPKSGILGSQLFQGWGVSGVLTFQSGQPFTPYDSFGGGAYGFGLSTPAAVCSATPVTNPPSAPNDATLAGCTAGAATNRLAAVTSGSVQNRLDHYINPNFFSNPGPVPFGDAISTAWGGPGMRNIYRGPFQQDVDFSVSKTFHITERHQFVFRADTFNLFNHPVFNIPTCASCLDINSSPGTFGTITSTVIPARLMQFGLKYMF